MPGKKLSRRDFLVGSLAAGGTLATLGTLSPLTRLAHASPDPGASDRYFIFAYFGGGWDTLLSLDPRDPAVFDAASMRATMIYPGYELLQVTDGQLVESAGITFGPAIGDLAAHADKLAVIRGMSMDTLTHEAGRRRFLTGKPPSGLQARGSAAATWLAANLGKNDPIPNLSVRVESFNVDQPSYATAMSVNTVADLVLALQPLDPPIADIERQQIDELLRGAADCGHAKRSPFWQIAEQSRVRAQRVVEAEMNSLFDFMANTPEMEALRDHYGIDNAGQAQSSSQAQAALAAQAVKGGVSRVVSFQAVGGLDTHYDDWTDDQPTRQMQGFASVSRLIEDLERSEYKDTGSSWLDHTTIVGFSEFSRTALINDRGGRDHHLTNSIFVLGAGIQGGQVIGASTDVGLMPAPIDLVTGQPDPGGEIVRPEHIIQSLMHDIGITDDPADYRVPPLSAMMKTV